MKQTQMAKMKFILNLLEFIEFEIKKMNLIWFNYSGESSEWRACDPAPKIDQNWLK